MNLTAEREFKEFKKEVRALLASDPRYDELFQRMTRNESTQMRFSAQCWTAWLDGRLQWYLDDLIANTDEEYYDEAAVR